MICWRYWGDGSNQGDTNIWIQTDRLRKQTLTYLIAA